MIRSGPPNCKAVAVTFDMCPVREGTGYDTPLIQTLIERRIPATFFLSGRWNATHKAEVRALLAVPFFEIGTHGQVRLRLQSPGPAIYERHGYKEIGPILHLLVPGSAEILMRKTSGPAKANK